MATTPDPSEVAALAGVEETPAIASFIADAELLVEPCNGAYSDDRRTAIVKWLAAHLIASTPDGAMLKSETVDGASYTRVMSTNGTGLQSTTFGQRALELDTQGCLVEQGKRSATLERL